MKTAIQEQMEDIEKYATEMIRDVAKTTFDQLISPPPVGTPRDTSYAANSWQFSYTSLPADYTLASPEVASIAKTFQDMSLRVLSTESLKDRNNFYLVNPVFYIRDLNEKGTSKQTPSFFIERAIQKAVTSV